MVTGFSPLCLTFLHSYPECRKSDLPPTFRSTVNLVESVSKQGDGHEAQALHRGPGPGVSERG